jgi:hypothetical protein
MLEKPRERETFTIDTSFTLDEAFEVGDPAFAGLVAQFVQDDERAELVVYDKIRPLHEYKPFQILLP